MLFITGSNGIYAGEDLRATLPSSPTNYINGDWDGNNKYSWKDQYGNLMQIFTITKGTLNTDYMALKFTTSDYNGKYRVCFMDGGALVATHTLESAGKITIKISELKVEKGKVLSDVDNIKFGGASATGSITLDPKSIVLVGQLQNNTKRYDFSTFKEITNVGNVQSAKYENNELVVKTKDISNNYFPFDTVDKGLTCTDYSGVRVTAKGVKFRIVAKTKDDKIFQYEVPANDDYVTSHCKWEKFVKQYTDIMMTEADVANIKEIGLGGLNDDKNETDKVFYVKDFWFDDIADYNKTIPCYGYEGGRKDDANKSFVYTMDGADGATAVFEGNNDDRDANQNIMLNAGKNLKLSLSSDVNKFTEVCLVFGKETTYDFTVAGKQHTGTSTALICPVSASQLTIQNNSSSGISLAKIIYSSEKGINEERKIIVDGKTRKYWLYVPATLEGKANVPVVFSLHGRGNNDKPNDTGKPIFTSLAKEKNFIVVYPQGRDGGSEKADWNNGFVNTTGWEATGKKNADTEFIKALVEKIQSDYKTPTASNNNISVDPTKFYLCGFSMGGMMTYACAKVLNGTFAAYGSCGGFPLNEFHMSLATENPIPFIHLHGNKDNMLGINHLNTIIENLLFRNGCDLSKQKATLNEPWSETKVNGETHKFKKYDFTGVKGVPVTTVTFDELGHWVESSAPAYLWNFFSGKTNDMYKSDIEWKWDMKTINANIAANSSNGNENAFTYGWKHVINGKDRSLTYGGEGNTKCKSSNCTSANTDCNGNHNVYNSIQLTPGKHTLYAQMESTSGESSVTLRNILTGEETVARKVVDNSGTSDATTYNVLYEFEVGEGAEFSLELKRSDTKSACTLLEIRKGSYRPEGIKDDSQNNASTDLTDGKLAELTFENVDILPMPSGHGAELTSADGNMKLYLKSRLGIHDGAIDNKDKYIVKDPVFGHYFQNIPDADIYDRYGASDYMRVVLGENNSLSGHDGIDGIQTTGKVTIGFWVNGDIAVNRGLAYDEPSMFYIAGETYNGENKVDNPHMFNITCNGGLTGYMKVNDGEFEYHSGASSFGGLCDTESKENFYSKNFYKDCNWHYITYQMYDNLSRYNMYVDGEPTCLGGYAMNNASSLKDCISGLKSIVLGGANANNVKFAYDVAFAYDDIVIYNRVLSKREINKIIKKKNYSPSVWHFDRNLENKIFFNPDLLDKSMWNSSDDVYTLNTEFTSAAALTYDGITEIPAFKGLRFVANGEQIKIDAKSGALQLSQGVKVVFSNLVKDTYVRMEFKKENSLDWTNKLKNMSIFGYIPSPSQGCDRQLFKVGDTTSGENSITMPSAIDIIRMEVTDKSFAQIKFVDKNNNVASVVKKSKDGNGDPLPRLDLYVNNVERLHTKDEQQKLQPTPKFKFTSSSPHVASIDSITGEVALHGIAGSTVITAELINDENKYDCDIYDQYAFEPSNCIFSSYEIVVEPEKGTFCKVADDQDYKVGQTLKNNDGTVSVTLGGWTYNEGTYYGKSDEYSKKESWEGQKFEKDADRKGYLANSRKTEEDVFHEFFNDKDKDGKYKKETFSTNGIHAAKSEQLKEDYAATGNYSAPTNNKSVANATPWLLPCRGSHIKIEPTDAGLISVYVMQEGCVSHAPSGGMDVGGVHYNEDEPIDVTVKKVYVADEKGEIVKEVVADTKSKVAAQMHKDDGRARAEYFWGSEGVAYNKATMESFLKINDSDKWSFLDNWPNPGMQQHVFKLGNDKDGHVLITKGIVRYTFNVLPGKTYYIFSNTAKLGLAGFTFEPGKHAKYDMVQVDAKHKECRATGVFDDVSTVKDVTLEDGKDYASTDAKNAKVTLNRKFYRNYWNAICLPYSINRRQIEKVFGDGTMVVLMNNINTSTKKVMFIEHVNQDIIAGYPYLIFPTTKGDNDKTDHTPIEGITTRATFGEADSRPLFSVGTDGNTYPFAKPIQSDELVFKGTFTNSELNEGSYVVTNKGVLSRIPKDRMNIKPYRSYIYFNRVTAGAKAISLQNMNVNGFENEEDNTTGIENLLFESGILTHSADVYSIDGQLVRSKALNLNGLPKGVYIVNGKKYVKK